MTLLMPGASASEVDFAERLTRALCLLSSDAVDSGSSSVRVQMGSAREELDHYHSGTVGRLLQDLLIHVALQSLPPATYLTLPAPRRAYAEAWSHAFALTTEEERRFLGLEVPVPGMHPLEILRTLVEALERHGRWSRERRSSSRAEERREGGQGPSTVAEIHAQLWRVRYQRLAEEPAAAQTEALLEALLGQLSQKRGARARSLRTTVLSDLLALHLDRGQMIAARETVRRAGPTAQHPADARSPMDLLALAVKWMMGDPGLPALEAVFQTVSAAGAAPLGWTELVQHVDPARKARRHGMAAAEEGRTRWTAEAAAARRSWGASALIVSLVRPNGRLEIVHEDVAPGLMDSLPRWTAHHRNALAERGTPEHEVGCRAVPLVLIATQDRPEMANRIAAASLARAGRESRGPLEVSGSPPMALVVEPILDGDGEVAGLLWLEFSTRLVPASVHRAAAARALFERYGKAEEHRLSETRGLLEKLAAPEERGLSGDEGPRAAAAAAETSAAWEKVLAALQLKTAERRWIAFHVEGEAPAFRLRMVADGGEARDRLGAARIDGAWAIRRCLRTGGAIRYGLDQSEGEGEDQDAGPLPASLPAMLHRGAVSGVALPLHRNGRVMAVLSLESVRRGDAREQDVDRWFETLQAAGPLVEATILSTLDRRGFDGGFAFSEQDPDFLQEYEALCALGRSRADVLIGGETGAGRRTLARLIHQAGTLTGVTSTVEPCPAVEVRAAFGLEPEEIREIAGSQDVSTLAVADLEWLSPAAQAALTDVCAKPLGQRPRVLATIGSRDDASGESRLHPHLVRQLGRVTVRCRSLRDRRHAIPVLAEFLLRRMVDREGGPRLEVDDAAMATLWRQPWAENIAGLEAVLSGLFLRFGHPVAESWGADPGCGEAGGAVAVGVEETLAAILDAGLEIVPRLPSRAPRESDLLAALWVTRTATQRLNKTRAAMYLGWDPNTLAARLKDHGLKSLEQVMSALRASSGARTYAPIGDRS
ncbi:hypothetical protein [Planctomycetes bacterium Poly30]|uniref:hypothetical protein n=1 Tax=Saltatorellus ferox TaxID=2528018 RepID=UPI0011A88ED9